MDLFQAIEKRRSIKRFSTCIVPKNIIEHALDMMEGFGYVILKKPFKRQNINMINTLGQEDIDHKHH